MALRAFRSNPALGGFGSETNNEYNSSPETTKRKKRKTNEPFGTSDAFAQIVKELVDNAVDACSISSSNDRKRVRVVIEPIESESSLEVLRVTVTDNGCGMGNIQKCVSVFHSSKGEQEEEKQTAGRYGIGLTLCLLHAQRLVPNSYASITSATISSKNWVRARFVVDEKSDDILCVKNEQLKKSESSSGTVVSVLVPGGKAAQKAWPRLAEYFARFHLSCGLSCSLEVLAPTLSKLPLFIRPPIEKSLVVETNTNISIITPKEKMDEIWNDNFMNDDDDVLDTIENDDSLINSFENYQLSQNSSLNDKQPNGDKNNDCIDDDDSLDKNYKDNDDDSSVEENKEEMEYRETIHRAAQSYLNRPLKLENIAHSIQPIGKMKRRKDASPQLEVDVIVYPEEEEDISDELDEYEDGSSGTKANLMLVRMVNRIPLLDGAEAHACGIVRSLISMNSLWNSFGLDISLKTTDTIGNNNLEISNVEENLAAQLHIPTYTLKDSAQLSTFFFQNNHGHEAFFEEQSKQLPAGIRLGNILLIVQIHARPSLLPLPTLSKGRLPMNDISIQKALHNGIHDCFKKLQNTNPSLLLSTKEIKRSERYVKHVPIVSSSIASIICNARNSRLKGNVATILSWDTNSTHLTQANEDHSSRMHMLGSILENRLRMLISNSEAKKNPKKKSTNGEIRRSERIKRLNNDDLTNIVEDEPPSEQNDTLYDPLSNGMYEETDLEQKDYSPTNNNNHKKNQLCSPASKSSFLSNKSISFGYNEESILGVETSIDKCEDASITSRSRHSFSSCNMDGEEESHNQNFNEDKEKIVDLSPGCDEYGDEWW